MAPRRCRAPLRRPGEKARQHAALPRQITARPGPALPLPPGHPAPVLIAPPPPRQVMMLRSYWPLSPPPPTGVPLLESRDKGRTVWGGISIPATPPSPCFPLSLTSRPHGQGPPSVRLAKSQGRLEAATPPASYLCRQGDSAPWGTAAGRRKPADRSYTDLHFFSFLSLNKPTRSRHVCNALLPRASQPQSFRWALRLWLSPPPRLPRGKQKPGAKERTRAGRRQPIA